MRKRMLHLLCATACLGMLLTACGKGKDSENGNDLKKGEATEAPTKAPTEAPTEPKDDTAPTVTPEPSSDEDKAGDSEEPELVSEGPVNFEKMQFSVNGKTYILGKTTLKEMIDDGVPFYEKDLANAENNLNANTESQGFNIELGEYWSAMVYVLNDTDENKVTSDCYISTIYFPNSNPKRTQDVLTFEFPLTMTEDEIKALSIKPTYVHEYKKDDYTDNTYEFKKDSTMYFSKWGYSFDFTNGKLSHVTMDYLK